MKGPNPFADPQGKEVPYKPGQTESAPVATVDSENQASIGQGGSYIGQILGMRPSAVAAAQAGGGLPGGGYAGSNVSTDPSGKTGGFPDASGGDGSGRQPQSIMGSTVAAPRTPFDADQMGEGPKPRGSF